MNKRPGGELATRPLHFFWIRDYSGSMQSDGKIQSLNNAIKEANPHMQKAADENPNAQVLVRVLRFSDGAQWHLAEPIPVSSFHWTDLKAESMTDMGRAPHSDRRAASNPPDERSRLAARSGADFRWPPYR
jgi:hypothetical protein